MSSSLNFRFSNKEDAKDEKLLASLLEIINVAYEIGERDFFKKGNMRTNLEEIKGFVADKLFILAFDEDLLLGCIKLVLDAGDGLSEIGMFAVRSGIRGQGLGKKIYMEAERQSRLAGCTKMQLYLLQYKEGENEGKVRLRKFYEGLGYKSGEKIAYPFPEDFVIDSDLQQFTKDL